MVTQSASGFLYDSSAGPLVTICRCGYSVVPTVLTSLDYWLFAAIHLSIFLCYNNGIWPSPDSELGEYMHLSWQDVQVITALTTFFEVFYTNQCFTRYMQLYRLTCDILLTAQHLAMELRLILEKQERHARLILRYFLAAVLVHFDDQVQPGIAETTGFRDKLLLPAEQAHLDGLPRGQSLVVLQWAASVFLLAAKEAQLTPAQQKSVMTKIEEEYKDLVKLSDMLSLPVPFQYYHLLCLMVAVCVLCWGFVMGASKSYGGVLVFLVAELIFMGMIQLASDLSDPFGDDVVDFPLADWVTASFHSCETIMEYDHGVEDDKAWDAKVSAETALDLGIELDDGSGRWLSGWSPAAFDCASPLGGCATDDAYRDLSSDDGSSR